MLRTLGETTTWEITSIVGFLTNAAFAVWLYDSSIKYLPVYLQPSTFSRGSQECEYHLFAHGKMTMHHNRHHLLRIKRNLAILQALPIAITSCSNEESFIFLFFASSLKKSNEKLWKHFNTFGLQCNSNNLSSSTVFSNCHESVSRGIQFCSKCRYYIYRMNYK